MGLFDFFSRKKKDRNYEEDIDRVFDASFGGATGGKDDFHRPEMRQHFVFDKYSSETGKIRCRYLS